MPQKPINLKGEIFKILTPANKGQNPFDIPIYIKFSSHSPKNTQIKSIQISQVIPHRFGYAFHDK